MCVWPKMEKNNNNFSSTVSTSSSPFLTLEHRRRSPFFAIEKFLSRHLSRVCSDVNKTVMAINDLERAEFIIFYKCYQHTAPSPRSTTHFSEKLSQNRVE